MNFYFAVSGNIYAATKNQSERGYCWLLETDQLPLVWNKYRSDLLPPWHYYTSTFDDLTAAQQQSFLASTAIEDCLTQ